MGKPIKELNVIIARNTANIAATPTVQVLYPIHMKALLGKINRLLAEGI
ncbi:MAG: hypothetical protein NZ529_11290 [Cytophagaceae bacterium]|nr:hypothetical protein [Cytophagaceae bacterium]MDW8457368.1 hypothetical protein [Cytophagaceae bacterium]